MPPICWPSAARRGLLGRGDTARRQGLLGVPAARSSASAQPAERVTASRVTSAAVLVRLIVSLQVQGVGLQYIASTDACQQIR